MVEINITYRGDLHTTALHLPSGATIDTDAPKDNEGLGETFSPTDLLATALGSCVLTTMGIVARRNGWDLKGSTAHVVKTMTGHPNRRIESLEIIFELPEGLDGKARTILERSANACPVHRSLSSEVETIFKFTWVSTEDREA